MTPTPRTSETGTQMSDDSSSSLETLLHMITTTPKDPQHYILLGQLGIINARFEDVKNWLAEGLEQFPKNAEILYLLAHSNELTNELGAAQKFYHRALETDPLHELARARLVAILCSLGALDEALPHLKLLCTIKDKNPEYRSIQARVLFALSRSEEGLAALKAAHHCDPDNAQFKVAVAHAVNLFPNDPQVLIFAASIADRSNRHEGAIALLSRALELHPDNDEACLRLVGSSYLAGDPDRCIALHTQRLNRLRSYRAQLSLSSTKLRILTDFTSTIGHMGMLDGYRKLDLLGWMPESATVLLPPEQCPNKAFLHYVAEPYHVAERDDERAAYRALLPFFEQTLEALPMRDGSFMYLYDALAAVQREWEKQGRGPLFELKAEHAEKGFEFLERRGFPRDGWFVVLHVRDTGTKDGAWIDRRRSGRCAHIQSYLDAIKEITSRGGWVIRVGDRAMPPLPANLAGVIDYAFSGERYDWLEVFLWARARFYLGTPSGPSTCPPAFGTPVAHSNYVSQRVLPWPGKDVFIPKLLFCRKRRCLIPFSEHATRPELRFHENLDLFERFDIELADNTSEELVDFVREMLDRTSGAYVPSPEHAKLQALYRDVIRADWRTGSAEISVQFLKRHATLLC